MINTHHFTFRKQTCFLQASSEVYYDGATLRILWFLDFAHHSIFKN
jgi:hypothetical protein